MFNQILFYLLNGADISILLSYYISKLIRRPINKNIPYKVLNFSGLLGMLGAATLMINYNNTPENFTLLLLYMKFFIVLFIVLIAFTKYEKIN